MPGDGCLNGRPLIAEVRKIVLPATTGEDQPRPGTSMAHFTCSVFDHVSGRLAPSAKPRMPGPRKPGHSAGTAASVAMAPIAQAAPASAIAGRLLRAVAVDMNDHSTVLRRRL